MDFVIEPHVSHCHAVLRQRQCVPLYVNASEKVLSSEVMGPFDSPRSSSGALFAFCGPLWAHWGLSIQARPIWDIAFILLGYVTRERKAPEEDC